MFLRTIRQILLHIFCFLPHIGWCQYSGGSVSIENILKGHSVYIQDEKLDLTISGKDNVPWFIEVNRKVVYKIADANGITYFRNMTLPEAFDPSYIPHGPEVKKLGTYYSGYKLEELDVKVRRDGVKPFSPKVKKRFTDVESFNIDYLYRYSQHSISISGLEVGDELELSYHVRIPFGDNYTRFASYRIFFHDSLPKLNYELKLTHHETLDIELFQYNDATYKSIVNNNHFKHTTWKYQNLPGCIDEIGAKPYRELPHITWVLNHYKYYVHSSSSPQNIPHYAIIAYLRTPNLTRIMNAIQIRSQMSEYAPFNRKYDEMVAGTNGDHLAIHDMHRRIIEDYKYEPDRSYYRREDPRAERLGEFFENEIVRDMSRYNMYFAIFSRADLNFFSAFLMDNRVGEISDHFFQPCFDNDFLLGTYFGEKLIDYLVPKSSATGLYYNELPFYWENTKVRLVHVTDYAEYKRPIREVSRFTKTPSVDDELNYRFLRAMADVDPDMDSASVNGVLKLSGQFSTIGRHKYLGGRTDPTVDKDYLKRFWEIGPNSTVTEPQTSQPKPTSPFDCRVQAMYRTGGIFGNAEDGTKTVDLSDWFMHIVPDNDSRKARFLQYHPDFVGTDLFDYTLRFPRPVAISDTGNVIHVNNAFGEYKLAVRQEHSNQVQIKSSLRIFTGFVSSSEYEDVRNLYEAVERGKRFQLNYSE